MANTPTPAPDEQVYLDIKAQLQAKITQATLAAVGFKSEWSGLIEVELFNNQFANSENGQWTPKALPMIVVGFVQAQPWKQIGNGVQFLDPFDIRIHIILEWFNDGDNSDVDINEAKIQMRIRQLVYEALQEFEPTAACKMVRIDETLDEDHTNMIHYIQTYRSNLIDSTMMRPVGGISSGAITLEQDLNIVTVITPE